MESLESIKHVAASWVSRRGGEGWTAADEAQLSQWLEASTRNLIAYVRMEATLRETDRLKVLGAGFRGGEVPSLEDFRSSPFFQRVAAGRAASSGLQDVPSASTPHRAEKSNPPGRRSWPIAASILVAAAAIGIWIALDPTNAYSTSVGVTTSVPLSDGSKVTLNTDSEIRVAVTQQERKVALDHGEAFFEVVPDPARPFVVTVGEKRVIVLGTKFSVFREGDDIRVVVTEGRVSLSSFEPGIPGSAGSKPTNGVGGRTGPDTGAMVLRAGSIAKTKGASLTIQSSLKEAEELLSWRSGYVVFHETALADAVAEFNRYNTRKLVIEDPALAGLSISGNFRSTNVDSFVELLEDAFPVTVEQRGKRINVSRKQ